MAETLDALVPGNSCRVTSLQLPPHKQRRMQELGLTVGSTVTALHRGRGAVSPLTACWTRWWLCGTAMPGTSPSHKKTPEQKLRCFLMLFVRRTI